MIISLNVKYDSKCIIGPYFVYIEFFRIAPYNDPKFSSTFLPESVPHNTAPYDVLPGGSYNPNITYFTPPTTHGLHLNEEHDCRGSGFGPLVIELMRFYRIPVISVKDALFPSFTRFIRTHDSSQKFPFAGDGVHLGDFGCNWLVENLIVPFLMEQYQPRDGDAAYLDKTSIYDIDVYMFPRSTYQSLKPPIEG